MVTTFSHYKSMGIFSRHSRAANSAVLVLAQVWPNLELVRDDMVVLVTFKNEEDPIKNEGHRVFTTIYIIFGERILEFAFAYELVVGNTWSKKNLK